MKYLLLSFLLLTSLIFPLKVWAVEASPSPDSRFATRDTKLVEVRERRRERIGEFVKRIIMRLEERVARIEKLIERMETRLNRIEESDAKINTEAILVKLNAQKDELTSVKADLASLEVLLNSIADSENPKEVFAEARGKLAEVKQGLISVHRSLAQIIGEMKGLRVGQSNENEKE